MDAVETAIHDALQAIPEKAKRECWSDGRWSSEVKAAIVYVGQSIGCLTAANGCATDNNGEWLYDVVWYKLDDEGDLSDVLLVAESEWGNADAIKADFEKLLVARSKYRVMVFQAGSSDSIHKLIEVMAISASKYNQAARGDRYLLAGLAKGQWEMALHIV